MYWNEKVKMEHTLLLIMNCSRNLCCYCFNFMNEAEKLHNQLLEVPEVYGECGERGKATLINERKGGVMILW